jgi:Ca2+-binding RTX toxin-like protein
MGTDTLTGGAGADVFVFDEGESGGSSATDMVLGGLLWDETGGLHHGRIDLSLIDADTGTAGDQAFSISDLHYFTGTAGELIAVPIEDIFGVTNDIWLGGDSDGDMEADLALLLPEANWLYRDPSFTAEHLAAAVDFLL